jgi:hypothetical protein
MNRLPYRSALFWGLFIGGCVAFAAVSGLVQ